MEKGRAGVRRTGTVACTLGVTTTLPVSALSAALLGGILAGKIKPVSGSWQRWLMTVAIRP